MTKQETNQTPWILPVILATMTLLTSGLLIFSHHLTADRIAEQKLQAKLSSLTRLFPAGLSDNNLIEDAIDLYEPVKLGHRKTEQLYLGTQSGKLTAMAIPVTGQNGYSGDIDLLVGVDAQGQIIAVEIIAHKETPGLGDLIERKKSDWLLQFPGTSLSQPELAKWGVKKDQGHFDQITAATITPRAVVGALKKALIFQQEYLQRGSQNNE